MTRHQRVYRGAKSGLIILLGLWVGAMLLVLALPVRARNSNAEFIAVASIFVALFVIAIVLSAVTMVFYIRWTGKYPYPFLFGKARGFGDQVDKGQEWKK